jgi:hypothetical protein
MVGPVNHLYDRIKLTSEQAKELARVVRAYYEDELTYEDFLTKVPGKNNADVQSLLYAIEHQPAKRGFFGADNTQWHEKYKQGVFEELAEIVAKYSNTKGTANN